MITEDIMWEACQQLRPNITRAEFRLMWAAFMHERRRRERDWLYRWWGNLKLILSGELFRT